MITDHDRRRKAEALEHALDVLRAQPDSQAEPMAEAIATIEAHAGLLRFALRHPVGVILTPPTQLNLL